MLPSSLTIATRKSRLALWQAEHVQARLRETHPGLRVELLPMSTLGDEVLDRSLNEIGGKGLFTKELELALLDGRADLAVHSLKDVPMELGADFMLACVMRREDPRDAFVSARYASLEALPDGARVGTSSLRRGAQIRARHPRLQVLPLRGNLDTRLGKLDRGEYDAIVLAAAGLKRLGLAERIRGLLPSADSLPAVGQGALGIETLASRADVGEALAPLADAETWLHVRAERAVSRVLGGSCRVPLAAYCTSRPDGGLRLVARVARPDGTDLLEASAEAPGSDEAAADAIAAQVCAELLGRGAAAILAAATA